MPQRLVFPAMILAAASVAIGADPIKPIPRRIPPKGIEISAKDRKALENRLFSLRNAIPRLREVPDFEIYAKAIRLALANGEFYKKNDVKLAHELLDKAFEIHKSGKSPGNKPGLCVLGYLSSVDGSAQPYGLEIPAELDRSKPVPLYIWLHGRGDKVTDMHFIMQRLKKRSPFAFKDGITLHPFGRQCIGYKSAGEIDVLEAVADVSRRYKIDPNRVVLMGFSMGGAGAWHLG
ncbi:MAG: hypothetical protein R3236_11235, partial [Phycisphaeraceae bacterium]|nr:hypothetical protein [Phycisphaeraceae bacterium]